MRLCVLRLVICLLMLFVVRLIVCVGSLCFLHVALDVDLKFINSVDFLVLW